MSNEHTSLVLDIAEELGVGPQNAALCGSTLVCGRGKDIDVLVLLPVETTRKLEAFGYTPCLEEVSEDYDDSPFSAWRKGPVNLLVTADRDYFLLELSTAHAAAYVNSAEGMFVSRQARVDFHQYMRENLTPYRIGAEQRIDHV